MASMLTYGVNATVPEPKSMVLPLGRESYVSPLNFWTSISARDGGLIVTMAVSLSTVPDGLLARTQ